MVLGSFETVPANFHLNTPELLSIDLRFMFYGGKWLAIRLNPEALRRAGVCNLS